MTPTRGHEPAMPTVYEDIEYDGLSKREYLAALAMQGFCASEQGSAQSFTIAKWSIEQADAMIKALNGG